jgi:hypothetical protein
MGGIVKAEGLGDGLAYCDRGIAKLRLTMPPVISCDLAFALDATAPCIARTGTILYTSGEHP